MVGVNRGHHAGEGSTTYSQSAKHSHPVELWQTTEQQSVSYQQLTMQAAGYEHVACLTSTTADVYNGPGLRHEFGHPHHWT